MMDKQPTKRGYRLKDARTHDIKFNHNGETLTIKGNTSVDVSKLKPELKSFIKEVQEDLAIQGDLGFDIVLTSANEGKSGDGVHGKGSKHYTGGALDIRISDFYRGNPEEVNNAYEDPIFKYFQFGKGKEIKDKYSLQLLDPYHGSAPHLHLELEKNQDLNPVLSKGRFKSSKDIPKGHFHGDGHDHGNQNTPISEVADIPKPVDLSTTFTYAANNAQKALDPKQIARDKKSQAKENLKKAQRNKNFLKTIQELEVSKTNTPDKNVLPPKLPTLNQVPSTPNFENLEGLSNIPDEFIF